MYFRPALLTLLQDVFSYEELQDLKEKLERVGYEVAASA